MDNNQPPQVPPQPATEPTPQPAPQNVPPIAPTSTPTPPQAPPSVPPRKPTSKLVMIIIVLLVLICLVAGGVIAYKTILSPNQPTQPNQEAIEEATPTPFDNEGTPSPTASPSATFDAIESSVTNQSYTDLIPFMSESVLFEIEASEATSSSTPQETAVSMEYLNTAAAPWNFDQSDPIIMAIKEQYPDEYGPLFIGIASNNVLTAFGMDPENKINIVKVAVTYKILVPEE